MRADVEDSQDMGMIERARRLRLAGEPVQPLLVSRERRGQDLHRDIAVEAGIARAIDLAHPALAQLLEDSIGTEGLTGHDGADDIAPWRGRAGELGAQRVLRVGLGGPTVRRKQSASRGGGRATLRLVVVHDSLVRFARVLALTGEVVRAPHVEERRGADRDWHGVPPSASAVNPGSAWWSDPQEIEPRETVSHPGGFADHARTGS